MRAEATADRIRCWSDWEEELVPPSQRAMAVDLDTGEEIEHCFRADDITGEYEVRVRGEDGKIVWNEAGDGALVRKGKARLKIVFLECDDTPIENPRFVKLEKP